MMRPVEQPGVVVAEFAADDRHRGFELEEAVWAIGGKWEQQFMGHDGQADTLLPGVWLNATAEWDFKGFDGWQVPEPRRRCHGCHTVGLDPETGDFVEPNIGCESCHGRGSWHAATFGLGTIHDGRDVQVCGQCHIRGMAPDGEFFFPVGYEPGGVLTDHFEPSVPSPGQNSSHWWGNGRQRDRHQEFVAWRSGGHANSLESLGDTYDGRYGEVTANCLPCHAATAALDPNSRHALEDMTEGVTCGVCHNVHGALDEARISCAGCHGNGAIYHRPDENPAHVVCGDAAGVECVDCHMPRTIEIGGAFQLRDHGPGFVTPAETLEWGTPSGCQNGGCHVGEEPLALQAAFDAHYRKYFVEPAKPGVVQ